MIDYKTQAYHGAVKRFCRTMELKNDSKLIAEYELLHIEGES